MAEGGETWVIPMLAGGPKKNLGTTFRKIVQRAGVEVWPKPFQNCRSSRQTELEQQHPTYVVCKWLGNTPNIARRHYLQVTDDHYDAAIKHEEDFGDKRGMQTPESGRTGSHVQNEQVIEVQENTCFSEIVGALENALAPPIGLEPMTRRLTAACSTN